MKTSSCKSKGRRLQDQVRSGLRLLGEHFGLEADDIKSQIMGVSGVDIVLSPAAKKVLGDLCIECKNVEKLNTVGVFQHHASKYPHPKIPVLIHSRNRTEPMATMSLDTFLDLLEFFAYYHTKVVKGSEIEAT